MKSGITGRVHQLKIGVIELQGLLHCVSKTVRLFHEEEEIQLLDIWMMLSVLDLKYWLIVFSFFKSTEKYMKTSTFGEWNLWLPQEHTNSSVILKIHNLHIVEWFCNLLFISKSHITYRKYTNKLYFCIYYSNTHTARMWSCITDFFTYETTKSVVVKSWTIGIINRVVQLLIITYFIGWVFTFIVVCFSFTQGLH